MRVVLAIICLLLVPSLSYGQESRQPLQLTIKSDKQVYSANEKIFITLTIKNVSTKDIFYTVSSDGTCLEVENIISGVHAIFDGKEYKGPVRGCAWGGPDYSLAQGEEKNIAMNVADLGLTKEMWTSGKHNIAVKGIKVTSNTITIEVRKNLE